MISIKAERSLNGILLFFELSTSVCQFNREPFHIKKQDVDGKEIVVARGEELQSIGQQRATIIEALKFAITNQFPPNSAKGASFVNDPKLGNKCDAVAKVILDVENAKGDRITTTRRVKCTVKNKQGELSSTQLDATLTVKSAKGERKEINNKCADIKFEMCRVMGVSEAILNHVIFCHQEESCWPLEEGSKVKGKFDSIFNTVAYIKCVEQLVKEDKELQIKIKVEQEGLRFVIENRQTLIKKLKELDDKRIKLQEQTDRIKDYDKEIKVTENKLREFQLLEQEYSKKHNEVVEIRTKIEEGGKQIVEKRGNIKEEFRGTISELKTHIRQFKEESTEKNNECKKEFKVEENEYNQLDSTRGRLLKEEGMFQQEENANKKRLEELDKMMSNAVSLMKKQKSGASENALSVSFTGYLDACDGNSGNLSYDTVVKTLSSAVRMKESETQKVKDEFENEEKELQIAIDDIRSKSAAAVTERKMKQQQLLESKKTFEDIKKRLQQLEGSNETLALLDDDERRHIEQIEAIEKSGFMTKCDSEIKTLGVEVKDLEAKMSTLSDTINILVKDKSKMDQIAMLNRNKVQKQNDSKEIMRRMEDDLTALLGEVPDDGLLKAVDSKARTLDTELKQKKGELRKKEVDLGVTKSDLKRTVSELEKMKSKLDDCCPLCKRNFEAKALVKKLIDEIDADIQRMKENVPTLKKEIESYKEQQQRALKVKPVWDECQRLEKETIPSLKNKKQELEAKVRELQDEIEDITSTVSVLETDAALASKSRSDVALYEQCKREIKRLSDQIDKLENSRDPEARACDKSLSDAQMELQEMKATITNKRNERETKEEIRNKKREELNKLQVQKNKVKEEKLRITSELQNREALEQQKQDLEATTKDLQAKIAELTQRLPLLNNDLFKSEDDKKSCIKRKEEALKKIRNEHDVLKNQKFSISELHKQIEDFEKRKGKLAEVQQRMADCKEKLSACEQKKKEIVQKINSLKKEIINQQLKERELTDNLSLKEKEEEVSKLNILLKEKETVLSQVDNRGAATEKRELSLKHQQISSRYNELIGSRSELTKTIRDLDKEVKSPPLVNAETEYVQKVAKKTVYDKAQKDIRRYKTALETAIMQFHHKKMERINKILFEYWRRIYKGNDIDKIMIKTEGDKEPGANKVKVTSRVRKAINYRVVMCRRGVDIDMRGRCSAGQRVLASIIIRIALAESFGARCGIISLDEPTTNLDQKNINSLADALADLAEKMKSRKNFQLIVITHDQEFTSRLSGVDAVEKYWKVDRDKEGFSQITMLKQYFLAIIWETNTLVWRVHITVHGIQILTGRKEIFLCKIKFTDKLAPTPTCPYFFLEPFLFFLFPPFVFPPLELGVSWLDPVGSSPDTDDGDFKGLSNSIDIIFCSVVSTF
ncbi:DNA repair protein RAD50 [Orchesella cincta]|uniref:DNA repair protein RAD50 n=1 Tax=Orchesella cincta TaxID=48709 RepID=A0A1D2N6Z8_ORCCI|nr:DNA repair protein RAD50 [Orchesella cincta]